MGRKDKIVHSNDAHLGAKMRLARQDKGISLTNMSIRLEYTKSHLSSVENGTVRPSLELVEKYERVLELIEGELTQILKGDDQNLESQNTLEEDYELPEIKSKKDLAETPVVASLYGREQELAHLKHWIVEDRCQMVVLLGLGGIGKTTLAASFVEQLQDEFEYIFWRSLQNAPAIENILKSCIQFLSDYKETNIPKDVDEQVRLLLKCLQERRSLIVLDNLESILGSGDITGQYPKGYEGYGTLIQRMGEIDHQSCLLLTSREKPREVPRLEGKKLLVRSMVMSGVAQADAQKILEDEELYGEPEIWQKFINLYSGNPLALKLVAEPIRELFQGDIATFLKEGEIVVNDINNLLDKQFSRLSKLEQEIMYWLANERETVSFDSLREDIVPLVPRGGLQEALNSLRRRSMIETKGTLRFCLQPVVMDYVTTRFVEHVYKEITTETVKLLASQALIKAQAKEYIRMSQVRLILEPLANQLLTGIGKEECETKLKNILAILRKTRPQTPNYIAGNILNLLIQLGCDLRHYDFSELIVWQAYLQNVMLPDVNFTQADLKRSVFTDTFGSILSVTLSPDGKLLAAGTANGEVRLWDAVSGTPLRTYEGHSDWVTSVTFNHDGTILASGSDDQTIRLWEISTGQCFGILHDHSSRIRSVAFNPDGYILASGSEDRTIRLWEVSTAKCFRVLEGHTGWVRSVAFSPDGAQLASGSEDQTVRIWSVDTGNCIKIFDGHSDWVRSVSFSPNGCILASGCDDSFIRLWDVSTGICLRELQGHNSLIRSVAFSPDGERLASGGDDPAIRLWNVDTGLLLTALYGHSNRVYSVSFSPDSTTLVSGSDDQTIRLWDVSMGHCLRVLQGYSGRIRSVAFNRDGSILASGSEDQTIRLWDVDTGKCVSVLQGHNSRIRSVAFNRDGSILASGSEDPTIRLWDADTGLLLKTLQGDDWVYLVVFSPEGNILASSSEDPTVLLWDVHTGQRIKMLQGHSSWVYSVAFSPDVKRLASGSEDQTIRLWEVSTGNCLHVLKGHTNRVYTVAFSPDGTMLASGSHDQTIRLWDVGTGECIRIFDDQDHSSWIYTVAFSPDGTMLASGSEDPVIRLWDLKTGCAMKALPGHSSWVYSVAFNADGNLLASGSHDGTIRLWDVQAGTCLRILRSPRPYEGMKITHVRGLTQEQKATLKALGAIER